ncbi:MAG TPA: outer membrane protein assembly factor BamD [Tepidisphaeraceae bacterium]|jgi:outer membrane protein assembly factor BamD (BamD/ComL family)
MSKLICLIVLGTAAVCCGAPTQSWELRNGRWVQVQQQATDHPTTDPALDRAQSLLEKKQNTAARKLALQYFKSHPNSALRDRALFIIGQALYQSGDRLKSFYYFDELLDEFPESNFYGPTLQRQYGIADAYLNGYKLKFLGLPLFSADGEAIEMLYRIQQRVPGSEMAEKALLRTADYYYADSEFDLAADVYAVYAHNYPRSPLIPRVKLRQAFAALAQFRGVRFDATPLLDARAQLVDVAAQYPNLAAEENLLSVVENIDATFAAKIYDTADFYRRTNEPVGAVYSYRFLIKTYPDSREARRAKQELANMPQWALKSVEPEAGRIYAPTTSPSFEVEEK